MVASVGPYILYNEQFSCMFVLKHNSEYKASDPNTIVSNLLLEKQLVLLRTLSIEGTNSSVVIWFFVDNKHKLSKFLILSSGERKILPLETRGIIISQIETSKPYEALCKRLIVFLFVKHAFLSQSIWLNKESCLHPTPLGLPVLPDV